MLTMNEPQLERCTTCGVFPEPDRPLCAGGCGKRRPPCGCRRGWSQSRSCVRLGETEHRCPHCTLLYP